MADPPKKNLGRDQWWGLARGHHPVSDPYGIFGWERRGFLWGGGANPSPITHIMSVRLLAGQGRSTPVGGYPMLTKYFTHSWGWMAIDS